MKKTYTVILNKKNTNSKLTTDVQAWNAWCAMVKAGFLFRDLGFTHRDVIGVVDNNI